MITWKLQNDYLAYLFYTNPYPAQLVRALRYVNFNNTSSFSVETYTHSPSIDIPEQFEMIPRADFEKKSFFSLLTLMVVVSDHTF